MRKIVAIIIFISSLLVFALLGIRNSYATVEYHMKYHYLTIGQEYGNGDTIMMRLLINVTGETVQAGKVELGYDTNSLELVKVDPWDIFTIQADTNQQGKITIEGTTSTKYSGEGPFAIITFKAKADIDNLQSLLTINGLSVPNPTEPQPTPTINNYLLPTNTPTITDITTPNPTEPQPTATPTPPTIGSGIPDCPNLEGQGDYVLVIIPDSYTDFTEFQGHAQQAVEFLKNSNLDANKLLQKMTFRMSNKINIDYDVWVNEVDTNMDLAKAGQTRNECQGDGFLIISKKYPTVNHSALTGGFSVIGDAKTVVFHHSLFVTPHELGHALAYLFDEYNYDQPAPQANSPFTNCAGTSKTQCQTWQAKYPNDPKIGCFKVCGYTNWYRPTQWSAMNNNVSNMNDFNPPSLEAWNEFLDQ